MSVESGSQMQVLKDKFNKLLRPPDGDHTHNQYVGHIVQTPDDRPSARRAASPHGRCITSTMTWLANKLSAKAPPRSPAVGQRSATMISVASESTCHV